MAGPSLQKLLGYASISKAIQATSRGVPNPLPDAFMKSNTKCRGANVRWRRLTGERRTAKKNRYGAPAKQGDLRDLGEMSAKCIHFFEKQTLDPLQYEALQQLNSYEIDDSLGEVQRQIEEFGAKFGNTRVTAIVQALRKGILYFDADGNILPTSSGSVESVDFKMGANNQNQLNSIIAASWATASTDIPLHLRKLRKQARRLTGIPLRYAFYGENVPTYFFNNTALQQYLARSQRFRESYLGAEKDSGEIPQGLFGFQWIPAYEAFYEDSGGTNRDLWDPDTVVFTPEPNQNWWDIAEGSYQVPTTINIQADGLAAMKSTQRVFGMGGYGVVIHNPVTVENYYFDTFLPLLKNPDAIFQAVVAF